MVTKSLTVSQMVISRTNFVGIVSLDSVRLENASLESANGLRKDNGSSLTTSVVGLPLGEGRITTLTTKMAISKVTILRITAIITKANSIMVMDFRRKTEKSRKKGRWRNTNVTGSQKMGKIVKSATKPTTGRADRGSST